MLVYDKAYELKKALQESPQVDALRKAKEKVETDETQRKMVAEYLTKQFELQQAHYLGQKVDAEKMRQFEELSQIINLNPNIRDYLTAQYAFVQIFSDIQRIIGEAIEDLLPAPDALEK